mmetsp:Transcript_20192/g.23047  ORF Transcript_20192/g.23047 Transcript_20192/m.23047 type:complete len:99 (+) Transcript_20192:249-545(+)
MHEILLLYQEKHPPNLKFWRVEGSDHKNTTFSLHEPPKFRSISGFMTLCQMMLINYVLKTNRAVHALELNQLILFGGIRKVNREEKEKSISCQFLFYF